MGLTEALQREIERLPVEHREGAVAALALAMAERIDAGKGSPSECGKVYLQALETLRELVPPERKRDAIDELADRRAQRLAGGAAA